MALAAPPAGAPTDGWASSSFLVLGVLLPFLLGLVLLLLVLLDLFLVLFLFLLILLLLVVLTVLVLLLVRLVLLILVVLAVLFRLVVLFVFVLEILFLLGQFLDLAYFFNGFPVMSDSLIAKLEGGLPPPTGSRGKAVSVTALARERQNGGLRYFPDGPATKRRAIGRIGGWPPVGRGALAPLPDFVEIRRPAQSAPKSGIAISGVSVRTGDPRKSFGSLVTM